MYILKRHPGVWDTGSHNRNNEGVEVRVSLTVPTNSTGTVTYSTIIEDKLSVDWLY